MFWTDYKEQRCAFSSFCKLGSTNSQAQQTHYLMREDILELHAAEGQQQMEPHSRDQLLPKGPLPCVLSSLCLASVLVTFLLL